jgi:hypothetical protein
MAWPKDPNFATILFFLFLSAGPAWVTNILYRKSLKKKDQSKKE